MITEWRKAYLKEYRKTNKAKIRAKDREYYLKTRKQKIKKSSERNKVNADVLKPYWREHSKNSRSEEAMKFLKRRQIERKYKSRRRELNKKRDPEKCRAAAKRWQKNNPEKVKAIERRKYLKRKAKKINAT